ncbi:hypothetical protein QUA40_21620 [Microcoleus sp. Pol11C3]|uniref:hypothetical protein n=1 Tax=Microcoleus sp. Pol11C3 TaxID=3055390 RepID=UPI002FD3415F
MLKPPALSSFPGQYPAANLFEKGYSISEKNARIGIKEFRKICIPVVPIVLTDCEALDAKKRKTLNQKTIKQ